MSLIANAADRLLGAIVPRATAAAWSCPAGWVRKTCFCQEPFPGAKTKVWYDACCDYALGVCQSCQATSWSGCH